MNKELIERLENAHAELVLARKIAFFTKDNFYDDIGELISNIEDILAEKAFNGKMNKSKIDSDSTEFFHSGFEKKL